MFIKIRSVLLLAFGLSLVLASAGSHSIEEKGRGAVLYGTFLEKKEKQKAEVLALQNAIETWIVEKQKSHFSNYEKVKVEINENIEDFILDYIVIDRVKKNKKYSVVLRAKINEPKLMSTLLKPSELAVGGEESFLTFVFVAREQVGKVSRSEKSATQIKSKSQGIEKVRSDSKAIQVKSKENTIGASKVERQFNDEVIWDVSTTNEIDAAMGDVFTEANYLVIDAGILEEETQKELDLSAFVNDYRSGNDLSPKTKRKAVKGLQKLEDPVQYLAIGTLDIDEQRTDDKTGSIVIAVSITGQVLAIKKRGAAVAKVGPEVMFGEGPTLLVAKNNALKLAAESVANKLVAKLSSRNIR